MVVFVGDDDEMGEVVMMMVIMMMTDQNDHSRTCWNDITSL